MTGAAADSVRHAYLRAAGSAVALLGEPAVEAAWERPSALAKLTVGGLAAHLGRQVGRVVEVLAAGPATEPPTGLLDHYARSAWVTADLDDEPNVSVRQRSESDAGGGPTGVRDRVAAGLATLRSRLPELSGRDVYALPWTGWTLTLDDFLMTRMVELAVHSDDLAASVDLPTPELPESVTGPVLELLCKLAARRHGPVPVLRALSRTERAPATVSAF